MLKYKGEISASKSLMNRALIAQSFFPNMEILGFSKCDDVFHLKNSIESLKRQNEFYSGEGGTTFRFLTIRLSRESGVFKVKGSKRLFLRPQIGLLDILDQLNVSYKLENNELVINSSGWNPKDHKLLIKMNDSSQFASAVLLSAWDLPYDLNIVLDGEIVSESYWELTTQIVQDLGMKLIKKSANEYIIPQKQLLGVKNYRVESDLSSIFTMAAAGVLCGSSEILNFPIESRQPDRVFLNHFKKMNIKYSISQNSVKFIKTENFNGIEINLQNCPDLFPVLSILCAHAQTPSILFGARHLVHKESNRIQKISELLNKIEVKNQILEDGLKIFPTKENSGKIKNNKLIHFDPDSDHRLAMAAGILSKMGYNIGITHPSVVNKSFPEFWSNMGIEL